MLHSRSPCSSSPEKQRTLTILSAIMNFLYLRMERCEMMAEKVAHYVRGTASLLASDAWLKKHVDLRSSHHWQGHGKM